MREFASQKAYARGIERRFIALRGSGLYLSPRDFALLLDWHARGVPSELVISAIEELFAKSAARSSARHVQSIAYCRHAVEEAWEERRKAIIGAASLERGASDAASATGAITPAEVSTHLDAAESAFRAAGTEFQAIAEELVRLRQTFTGRIPPHLQDLEEELIALEARSIEAAKAILTREELAGIARDVESQIAPFTSRMSQKVRGATIGRAVDSGIRARLKLPRLSLFTIAR